ncbi:MAG: acetyl-CoA decarbonylase/synthase complex subunit delta, partial [Desulfobacterales bacterium]
KEISIGNGKNAVTVGGETCYPFYRFEGDMPHKPKIAMEVWDMEPEDWPESALFHFKDVISDPAAWAKRCVEDFGAEMVALQLKSTDPNANDASPDDATATVEKVSDAVDVPLIVWGSANPQKDEEVLKKISEKCQGKNLTIGPVEDKNHKGIGASAMGYGHTVISSSPIDVNLAKQVNILLENLGVSMDHIIIDPTTGGLGYGMEYTYSVMERLRMAALTQGDDKLQLPIINDLGNEVWKCKEAKESSEEAPTFGDPEKRGILMEAVGAVSYLLAGSDILIMRHPEAVRMVRSFIDLITDGGTANDIMPIKKELEMADIDFAAISPEPDLTIEEEKEKKPAPSKKTESKPVEMKTKEPVAENKVEKKVTVEPETKEETTVETDQALKKSADKKARAEAEAEAKEKAAAEAKEKAEAEAKAKAEEKARAEAEAKAKAEAAAKMKAETEAREKREAEENALKELRAKERDTLSDNRKAILKSAPITDLIVHKSKTDKMLERLNRIHRRAVN